MFWLIMFLINIIFFSIVIYLVIKVLGDFDNFFLPIIILFDESIIKLLIYIIY
jgi:hypothetical protein